MGAGVVRTAVLRIPGMRKHAANVVKPLQVIKQICIPPVNQTVECTRDLSRRNDDVLAR